MKNHSLFQIILLAVFGALGLAGVLVFAFAVGGGKSGTTIGKVVIWGTLDKNAFNSVLDQAAQDNQELQQVTYVQKDPANFEQTLSDALAQNAGPDVFILSSDYAVKDAPKVSPISYDQLSAVTFQNIFTEASNVYLTSGGVEAIPFVVDPLVLYWNRDMLSSAGFAQPPASWEDVLQMAPNLTKKDTTGEIIAGAIAFGTYQNVENAKADLSALFIQAGVPITSRDASGRLASALASVSTPLSKQPAVDALGFYTGFADPSQNFYSWNGAMQNARAAFAAAQVALYVGYASEAPLIAATNPNLNFAIAPLPQFRDAARQSDFGRVYAFAVPRIASNPAGAFLAAQFLDAATTTGAFSRALGISPARRDELSVKVSGYQDLFNRMTIIAHTWADPDPVQTEGLFRAMIESTLSGAAPVTQALQRGDAQLSAIISGQ